MSVTLPRWHDLEFGAYQADLPYWRALAAQTGGPIVELGAGTGRVTHVLAADGHRVIAVDSEGHLLAALRSRSLPATAITTIETDIQNLPELPIFNLVIAPMLLLHLLAGAEQRIDLFKALREQMSLGTQAVFAVSDPLRLEISEAAAADSLKTLDLDGHHLETRLLASPEAGEVLRLVRERRHFIGSELHESVEELKLVECRVELIINEAATARLRFVDCQPVGSDASNGQIEMVRFEAI